MEIGIIGAPQSGKSTIFTAITGVEPGSEVGKRAVVKVPDKRLDHLTSVFKPKRQVNATVNFVDAPPASQTGKKGATQAFLNSIKTVDAILVVCPCFKEDGAGEVQDLLETLIIADLDVVEGLVAREKKMKIDPHYTGPTIELLKKLQDDLTNGKMLRNIELTDKETASLSGIQLLTKLPTFVVLNIGEGETKTLGEESKKASAYLDTLGIPYLPICGTLEAQIATLDPADREVFMSEFDLKETASDRVIREVFDLLGYQTFFTAGEDECRAWTIRKGDNAVTAAGKVHSDIAKGFIRAECTLFDDFVACNNSFQEAKAHAKLRLEGKEYIVKDGEICHFRHSG
jgi:hypothetical protein